MKNGTELFRDGKWVLRSRNYLRCVVIHECKKPSTHLTLSDVFHPPTKKKVWQCTGCNNTATESIITVWSMLNWKELNCEKRRRL